jgi:hypothetical protein
VALPVSSCMPAGCDAWVPRVHEAGGRAQLCAGAAGAALAELGCQRAVWRAAGTPPPPPPPMTTTTLLLLLWLTGAAADDAPSLAPRASHGRQGWPLTDSHGVCKWGGDRCTLSSARHRRAGGRVRGRVRGRARGMDTGAGGDIMGSQKCRIVGKSQPALTMINPMIFTRTTRRCTTR